MTTESKVIWEFDLPVFEAFGKQNSARCYCGEEGFNPPTYFEKDYTSPILQRLSVVFQEFLARNGLSKADNGEPVNEVQVEYTCAGKYDESTGMVDYNRKPLSVAVRITYANGDNCWLSDMVNEVPHEEMENKCSVIFWQILDELG